MRLPRCLALPVALLTVTLALAACEDSTLPLSPSADPETTSAVALGLRVLASDLDASSGSRLHLAIGPGADESTIRLGGVQATLWFDPGSLRYVGQIPQAGNFVAVNTSEARGGKVRLLAWSPEELKGALAAFGFDVLADDWAARVSLDLEIVGSTSGIGVEAEVLKGLVEDRSLGALGVARSVQEEEWERLLGFSRNRVKGPETVVGSQALVGDCRVDGIINVLDILDIANKL